ncbi:MAG: transglutaminase family protein [Candidatus Aenigmatarchaeota archaeon]
METPDAVYLKPAPLAESDDEAIKALAKKIVGKKSGEAAAKALFSWVRDEIEWQIVPVVGAKNVLARKPMRAECADKNNVLVALARAAGIPARYVLITGKLKVKRKDLDVEIPHVAAEVFVGGKWVLADPSYGKNTKNIIEACQWGKPIWKSLKGEPTYVPALPAPMFPDGINEALKTNPIALKYKELLSKK